MKIELILPDENASKKFAHKMATILKEKDVVALTGDLGTGKTYFVQAVCKKLKVNGYVNSPTFVLLNEYAGKFPIFHFDLYRLNDTEEVFELGIPDIFDEGLTFIEWPKIAQPVLPEKTFYLEFQYYQETKRKVIINSSNLKEEECQLLKNLSKN